MRGGYGNAGSGKKSDSKKPSNWATDYFGRQGFASKGPQEKTKPITIRDLEDKLPSWIEQKQAQHEAGTIVIDLEKLGYTKLLGTGAVTKKLKITVPKAAEGVAEKIKAAGGELVVKK
jgi:large subunit ribosomal protein L15